MFKKIKIGLFIKYKNNIYIVRKIYDTKTCTGFIANGIGNDKLEIITKTTKGVKGIYKTYDCKEVVWEEEKTRK